MSNPRRKIIQIALSSCEDNTGDYVYALCDDGTVWVLLITDDGQSEWDYLAEIPQYKIKPY